MVSARSREEAPVSREPRESPERLGRPERAGGPERAGRPGSPQGVVVVIPAGGTARRLGGVDKPALDVGGDSILGRILEGARAWRRVVVAAEPAPELRVRHPDVLWCSENPPGGGPAAALAAGLRCAPGSTVLVALAGDQPWAAQVVPRLLAALRDHPDAGAAISVDGGGRRQPLLAAYRVEAVASVLADGAHGRPVRALAEGVTVVEVEVSSMESLDVDDEQDLARARTVAAEQERPRG